MKYKLSTEEESIPLIVPEGQVMSGGLCSIESQIPINKGDKIALDEDDMKANNFNVREVEVVQNPIHIINKGQVTISILPVKKIS